jgi:hypothetical protein
MMTGVVDQLVIPAVTDYCRLDLFCRVVADVRIVSGYGAAC